MKSISIMSGVLSSESGAPLFSDAFPELVNPDNRKFVDYFKGELAVVLPVAFFQARIKYGPETM